MEWPDAIGKSIEYIEEHIADAYDPYEGSTGRL